MPKWTRHNLRWATALLLSPLLLEVSSGHQNAKAVLFRPLIQLLQPRIERLLVSECRQLAAQALDGVAAEIAPQSWLNGAIEQPCRTRPAL